MNEITVSRRYLSMITIDTYLNGEFKFILGRRPHYINPNWINWIFIKLWWTNITPDVKVFITPIAPHNLNVLLVVPDETEIRLKVSGREENYLEQSRFKSYLYKMNRY
jgi:NAD+ kinase